MEMSIRELAEKVSPEQAARLVGYYVEKGKLPPFFDHRLDEILEVLKAGYELEHGWYYSTGVEEYTMPPRSRIDLLWVTQEWRLLHTLARIELPDDRKPEVYFVVYHDGFETIDDPPYKYYDNGLVNPNQYGWVTKYPTGGAPYIYAWIIPWNLTVRKELRVQLVNDTSTNVTVHFLEAEAMARPYARYIGLKKTAKTLKGGWG